MKEPKPLLREGASDFERQLLGAVMGERPSPQLRSRMRRTLGLTGPIAWAGSAKAMLMGLAGKSALGVAVVALGAAGFVGVRSMQAARDDSRPSPAPEASVMASEPAVAAPKPAAPPVSERNAQAQSAGSGELREEILLLDQVRTSLQQRSSAAALEQLDHYSQRFPSGILSREAALLRQQAAALGRTPRTAR